MNNNEEYKKVMDQIHAPEELKQRTLEKMNKGNEKVDYMPLKLLSAVAVIMIVFVAGQRFFDSKNIVYTDVENQTKVETTKTEKEIEELPRFKDKNELVSILKKSNRSSLRSSFGDIETIDAVMESAEDTTGTNREVAKSASDYSTTNNQVENVDEADIVKTDGKNIYYISNGIVNIVDANQLEIIAELNTNKNVNDSFSPNQLFINGNKLIVMGSYFKNNLEVENEKKEKMISYAYFNYSNMTKAIVYDITDAKNPKVIREVTIDGYFRNARMIEDNIYMISNKGIGYYDLTNIKDEEILPVVYDSANDNADRLIPYTSIVYFPGSQSYNFTLVCGFNINNDDPMSVETFFGAGDTVYCSENNLYMTQFEYNSDYTRSFANIYKFELDNSKVKMAAKGKIEGYLNDQFSLDEYEGNLRIAATVIVKPSYYDDIMHKYHEEVTENRVYILDENLEELSRVDNMARGERIYAVRFMGKVGYVVTFEQVDPLFVLDLSDPRNPEIKGELKIPGYSSYLHPFDDKHVIGIGYNTKDNGYGGVANTNLKMSMFDISDLSNPKEMFSIDIGDDYSYSEVLNNHKALFYKASDNLIGFGYTSYSDYSYYSKNVFEIFHIDLNKGFESYALFEDEDDEYYTNINRMIYIEDIVYGLSPSKITAYDLHTQEKIKELKLNYDADMPIIYYRNSMPFVDEIN